MPALQRPHKAQRLRRAGLIAGLITMLAAPATRAELPVAMGSQLTATPGNPTSPVTEWRYTLRPGENLDTVARELLSEPHTLAQLMQYNGFQQSRDLSPGQSLRIPVNWLEQQPEPARAVTVSGPVQHIDGVNGKRRVLTTDIQLRAGDEIRTGSGFTVVQLADGSLIRLGRDTHLVFNRLSRFGKTGMVDTRMRLDRGELDAEVETLVEDGSRFEVDTPSAVAAVRGTKFSLQANRQQTRLRVIEGRVAFGPSGRTVSVPAGYSGTAGEGTRSPVDIRRLPAAPAPGDLPATVHELPLPITWPAVARASRYQVDIFDADSGNWLSRETTLSPELNLGNLENGRYEIRLAAISHQGTPGMPVTKSLTVDQKALAAALDKPSPDAKLDDEMPSFSWSYQGNNELGRIELAESPDFSQLVATSEWAPDSNAIPSRALEPGEYYWRVVTKAGGTSQATSEPRKLMINGTLPPTRIINVNYVDSQVRIFWQQVNKADEYRLQLSEDPSFQRIIKEASVADTTAALRLIPGRRYFVRLKALSEGPINGRWGPGRELFVN
ncbi:FecR domain-containing protein [Marinobacter bohaiensis]|uniref:FecR domain-containing protein n=1 Tax=Marinobacter bohaiensis TaxID=2201898 RepID=UPI000DAD2144|nr:FecR domain-containing protein [Marinobacter bohaiensis]